MIYHNIAGFPASMSPSSHLTESQGFISVTGQFARNLQSPDDPLPDGIEAQTRKTLENLVCYLKSVELTLNNILSMRVFLLRFERDYESMNEVYKQFFPERYRPTRTCVGVSGLVRGALIEVDCLAVRERS